MNRFVFPTMLVTCAFTGITPRPVQAQETLRTHRGSAASSTFGFDAAPAGDVDRDGVPDILVGSPGDRTNGVLSGAAWVFSGRDGRVLHVFRGPGHTWGLGGSVCSPGDLNGDGHSDLVVGASVYWWSRGRVRVFSGKDGALLRELDGPDRYSNFGSAVAGPGDLNGDGVPDFVVGAAGAGLVQAFSGKDGKVLHSWRGDRSSDKFGEKVEAVGDVDKDGTGDIAVGTLSANYVRVLSGRTGKELHTFRGRSRFGWSVAGAGDLDLDGHADVVVGAFEENRAGTARVFSGKTGQQLLLINGDPIDDGFGYSVAGIGDLDGDGRPDLAVGTYKEDSAGEDAGSVRVFSGRNGRLMYTVHGAAGDQFGQHIDGLGDLDRDGHPDFLVATTQFGNRQPGYVRLVSGAPKPLAGDAISASISWRGTQRLSINAGRAHAGRVYILLGSLSGTSPGTRLGPVLLPLRADAYFGFLAANPNTLIANSVGVLDVAGGALATLRLPASRPVSLAGSTLHHAYVVLDPNTLRFEMASNAVPLRLKR